MTREDFQIRAKFWQGLHVVSRETFVVSLVLYVIFAVVEELFVGFVSGTLSRTFIELTAIGAGAVYVLTPAPPDDRRQAARRQRMFLPALVMGVMAALIVHSRMAAIGRGAFPLAVMSGAVVVAISLMFERQTPRD